MKSHSVPLKSKYLPMRGYRKEEIIWAVLYDTRNESMNFRILVRPSAALNARSKVMHPNRRP